MCGIVGAVLDREAPPPPDSVLDALGHRGPDSRGAEWLEAGGRAVWFGHTRLAILDLSEAGHEPMASRDGRWWITYNGEIYNHLELRGDLPGPYRGHSDAETLVEALAHWGIAAALPRLNGMFAFAALDTVEGRLYLVRDPFGIKPLYHTPPELGAPRFASEARGLRPLIGDGWAVDPDALQTFLTLRYVPSPRTLWRGVRRLPPGSVLSYGLADGKWALTRYIEPTRERFRGSLDDAASAYHEVLSRAVERQLLSDVPVGVLLSGGIDSALVAALAADRGRRLPAFTVGFGEGHPECEIDDAAQTARVLGLPHRPIAVTPDMLWDALPKVIGEVEEPLGTWSILLMWHLVRAARRETTVVLTGQGSDEPWGGYFRYQAEVLRRILPGIGIVGLLRPLLGLGRFPEYVERGVRSLPLRDLPRRFEAAYSLFFPEERRALTGRGDDGGALGDISSWLDWIADCPAEPVERMMRIDSRMNLADDLLLYGDKSSMAVALEARVPMLDQEVVRFVESLPRAYRVRWRGTKVVHKRMAERYLPPEIVNRPKKGFTLPFAAYSRGPWRERMTETLLDEGAASTVGIDPAAVETIWRDHLSGKRDLSRKIYALLSLMVWARRQPKS